MISVSELRIDYDDVCAVDDLTLEIQSGEVFGLIGPNGAGKTSTMRAIAGLLEPTYGSIEVSGVDAQVDPVGVQRQIGYMPDFPPLYDDLHVWEFLDLFAASYGLPRPERPARIDEILGLVGLTQKRGSMIADLSRGMRQRLMLGKTLLPRPAVLLLDEPASGMDPNGRIEFKQIVRELAAAGCTVLVSSHILTEMSEFCTSVGIMEKGRMVVSGKVDEIASRVMGAEILTIEVLDGVDQFLGIVEGAVVRDDDTFEVAFEGDAHEASELLARLLSAGVRIASFARKKENLEDIFLKVGTREVS